MVVGGMCCLTMAQRNVLQNETVHGVRAKRPLLLTRVLLFFICALVLFGFGVRLPLSVSADVVAPKTAFCRPSNGSHRHTRAVHFACCSRAHSHRITLSPSICLLMCGRSVHRPSQHAQPHACVWCMGSAWWWWWLLPRSAAMHLVIKCSIIKCCSTLGVPENGILLCLVELVYLCRY